MSTRPNEPEAYAHLGLLEAREGHYKAAIGLYRKALSLDPKMPNLRLNLGLSLFKAGELRAAIETLEPLLRAAPGTSPEALRLVTLIGLAHYGLGDHVQAIPYLKKAAAGDPENLTFRMDLAQSCLQSRQYQCVLDTYREILMLDPESAEADMLAGEAYDELHNEAKAMDEFQAAIKAAPATPNAHFGYGYMLWRLLKFDQAEKEFASELANNPEHPLALTYLGDSEIKLNRADQAARYLQPAIRFEPSIALAHLDLGLVYEGQGRTEDALREIKAAERISPNDSKVLWSLGKCYQSVGRKAEANTAFEKIRNLKNEENQSLRDKLQMVKGNPPGRNAGGESGLRAQEEPIKQEP